MTALSLKTRRAARRQGVRHSFLFLRASGAQLDQITKLVQINVLRPVIDPVSWNRTLSSRPRPADLRQRHQGSRR